MDKKQAHKLTRDMTAYETILTEITRFFKAGEDITILDIGVRRATSTNAFLKGLVHRIGKGYLYSIDIDDRSDRVTNPIYKEFWTFIHGDSTKIEWDKPIDVLLIDGSHSYEGVKADFEKYVPFVKDDGLIIMHDVNPGFTGASKYWEEIKYNKFILNLNKSGLGFVVKK
jgi:predicted O-methyltransferase YrrM